MFNFEISHFTHILFGQNQLEEFIGHIHNQGYKNILLVYGKDSIKKLGLYSSVVNLLHKRNINTFDLAGIDPNPRLSTVRQGIQICQEQPIDFILALGGGSTIDCAKAIALGAKNLEQDIWDIIYHLTPKKLALPIGTILTLAATGSENNASFVISNTETKEKLGYSASPILRPKITLLDPTLTYTVNQYQTASGCADILSHIMENYFSAGDNTDTTDRILEGIAKSVITNAPMAIHNPSDYSARYNLMWAASMALNGIGGAGRKFDSAVHTMEHALSAHFDIPHGYGLAILYPHFLEYAYNQNNKERYVSFFKNVFDLQLQDPEDIAQIGIAKLADFFTSIGCPKSLKDFNIPLESLSGIAKECIEIRKQYRSNPEKISQFAPLGVTDIENIYKESY